MTLLIAQLQTLKTNILANSATLQGAIDQRDGATIAAFYNFTASPSWTVWKTSVALRDVMKQPAWDWTRVDNLSVGRARIWEWIKDNGMLNASEANVRAGIDAVWVGTQADLNVRAAVYIACKRFATRAEKLFSTGAGSDASPATMAVEGNISGADVLNALDS